MVSVVEAYFGSIIKIAIENILVKQPMNEKAKVSYTKSNTELTPDTKLILNADTDEAVPLLTPAAIEHRTENSVDNPCSY